MKAINGMIVNQLYKVNKKDWENLRKLIWQDTTENSMDRVKKAFEDYNILYLKLTKSSKYEILYDLHYKSGYNEHFDGPLICIDSILYKPYEEVSKRDKSYLDNFVLEEDDIIKYNTNCREITSIVHDSAGEKVKDSVFADDDIISITRNNKIIYDKSLLAGDDKLTAEQIRKRAEKLMLNSIYGKCCDAMDTARYALKEDKKEKVMDMNKCATIRSIIENYVNDCEKEYRAQYETKVKLIKADDVIGDVAKQLQDIINKNRFERNMTVIGNELEEVLVYSKVTDAKIKAATSEFDDKITNLHKVCHEAENLCNLCDTYEEMRKVLADYDIIPNTKKRGK